MGMGGQPNAVAPFHRHGCTARPEVSATVRVEAGGGPRRHAPGVLSIAVGMNTVQIDLKILNVWPDTFPLTLT